MLSLRITPILLLLLPVLATASRIRPARLARAIIIDPALVPEFGIVAGTNPTGTGDCTGVNGILIPCSCPPDRDLFLRDLALNVAAGRAVNNSGAAAISFPTGFDKASVLARLTASTITLQNLFGPGVGCPQAATTFGAQVKAAQALGDAPVAVVAAPPTAAPAAAPVSTSSALDVSLIPEFGVNAGQSPDGTGNCVGFKGILIPCTCPPPRDLFISQLNANVAAGRAVNNPGLPAAVSFPTGSDNGSVLARLTASTITLQNLFGPGVGCPQAATTFGAQAAAAQALGATSAAPVLVAPPPAAPAAAPAPSTSALDVSLIPEFGVNAGQSPDGTGNCVGVNGILIPCTCPPPRDLFINQLNANVAAGRAVNNPGLPAGVSFPTGSDKASVLARLNASTITLQNLFGPGKGCPQAATTFGAQVKAAQSLAR